MSARQDAMGAVLALVLGVAGCGDAADSTDAGVGPEGLTWPTEGWQVSTPEAEGMDPQVLDGAREYAFQDGMNAQGVVVIRHGKVVAEWYGEDRAADSWAASWSVAKSFTATAIGIAIDDGLIESVSVPLAEYFPDWAGTEKEAIQLEHVLHMATGLDWVEDYSPTTPNSHVTQMVTFEKDHLNYSATITEPILAPGTLFNYSSGATMLLSGVLEQATGMTAGDYAQQEIFAPLGIEQVEWWTDAVGHTLTYCCLDMPSREFAKLGLLYARRGRWEDEQLVSEAWVDAALDGSGPSDGYGYQIWLDGVDEALPDDLFTFSGHDGQLVYTIPSLDLIVVRNGIYYKYDGPAVGDPFLFTRYPSGGLAPMEGTDAPATWDAVEFLTPIFDSIE